MAIQKVFPMLLAQPDQNPKQLALELNLLINTATDTLQVTVQEVLQRYPNQVQAYQKGKKGVLGLFMGEVMKKLEGKVDPQLAREIILQRLAIK
jgi:aspartyl-tRNA(Asn)/glutamyl-tRNA(Gln) amidotransferase subunit B